MGLEGLDCFVGGSGIADAIVVVVVVGGASSGEGVSEGVIGIELGMARGGRSILCVLCVEGSKL